MKNAVTSGILTSLPGRYAKALFDLAKENKQVDDVGSALADLSMLIHSSPDLKLILENPTIKSEDQEAALKEICVQMKTPEMVQSFAGLLVNASRISYLDKIRQIYENLTSHAKSEQKIEVISAYPLTKVQSKLLKENLNKVASGDLILTFITDPKVLGGIMVRIGSRVIDATLATQLNQLATVMKGNA
ncbi:MAG: ATP synthase F1 subunit delta [Alphaproteobacteria bacterium]|nr:ATP synthase F1 subunit delta [Alphaproteobacteria bacterium]